MRIEPRYVRLDVLPVGKSNKMRVKATDCTGEVTRALTLRDRMRAAVGEHDQSVRNEGARDDS